MSKLDAIRDVLSKVDAIRDILNLVGSVRIFFCDVINAKNECANVFQANLDSFQNLLASIMSRIEPLHKMYKDSDLDVLKMDQLVRIMVEAKQTLQECSKMTSISVDQKRVYNAKFAQLERDLSNYFSIILPLDQFLLSAYAINNNMIKNKDQDQDRSATDESCLDTAGTCLDTTSPYYLHPSDGPQITICPIVLLGDNYNEWAQSMRNSFRAKNKFGFFDGTIVKPTKGSPEEALWVTVNSTLVGWIHNTLDPILRSSVPLTDDVKDMWGDLRQRFSIGNGPRIHELKSLLNDCKQRGQPVINYYNELRKLWDELAGYSKVVSACTCGAASDLIKEKEDDKVHDFLAGLDSSLYGYVVSSILIMDPLPSLNTVFAKVLTEERHHQTVARAHETKSDVGFAAHGGARGRGANREADSSKTNRVCSHCSKPGHDKQNCFQLVGIPDWYSELREGGTQGRGGGRAGRAGGRGSGRGKMVAETTSKSADNTGHTQGVTDSDRRGPSKGQSSSTEKLNGPHPEDYGGARGRGGNREADRSKTNLVCSHCLKLGHDKKNCFQLVGFPDSYSEDREGGTQGRGGGRAGRGGGRGFGRGRMAANAATTSNSAANTGHTRGDTDSDRRQPSKGQSSSTEKSASPDQWIIDTGCSNHMTGPHLEDYGWNG